MTARRLTAFGNLQDKQKGAHPQRIRVIDPGEEGPATFFDYKIAQVLDSVNTASKVVDENGEPKAMFHQTGNVFDTFDVYREGRSSNDSTMPYGVFMKPDESDIGFGDIQMPLFTSIKSPLYFEDRPSLEAWAQQNIPGYKKAFEELQDYEKQVDEASEKTSKMCSRPTKAAHLQGLSLF